MSTATATMASSGTSEAQTENTEIAREEARWRPLLSVSCQLTVELPVPHFRVADFLKLAPGSVMSTHWQLTRDVPLRVNGTLIGWGEFDGSREHLAVRLTELA